MKRVFTCLLLAAVLLAGCGKKQTDPAPEKDPAPQADAGQALAADCAGAYAAITEDLTFLVSVEEADGTVTTLDITPDNAWNVAGRENLFALCYDWSPAEAGDWEALPAGGGTLFTLADADSKTTIQCRSDSDLVRWQRGGGAVSYASAVNPREGEPYEGKLCRLLAIIAEDAVSAQMWDAAADDALSPEEAAEELGERVAENYRAVPAWVTWKPEDAAFGGSIVFDWYKGQPENFCCGIGLRVSLADPEGEGGSYWQAGAGLGEPDEDGCYGWGCEALVKKNEAGDWYIAGRGTGGYTVELPLESLDSASLEQLTDAFFLTEGSTHDWLLPFYILSRSQAELSALPALLDQRTEDEARALCRLLADCAENTKESWPWTLENLEEALGEYGPYLRA